MTEWRRTHRSAKSSSRAEDGGLMIPRVLETELARAPAFLARADADVGAIVLRLAADRARATVRLGRRWSFGSERRTPRGLLHLQLLPAREADEPAAEEEEIVRERDDDRDARSVGRDHHEKPEAAER